MVGGLAPPMSPEEEAAVAAAASRGAIFVLEGASLETAKVGKVRRAWSSLALCKRGEVEIDSEKEERERQKGRAREGVAGIQMRLVERPTNTTSKKKKNTWKKKKPPQKKKKKTSQSSVLLNCDDHASFLRRHGRDPASSRPDIAHQALLALLDSPLAKAGKIKALYLTTAKNVVIRINPAVRLPRTFKRFCGLFSQLLQKLSVRASNGGGSDKLLKVVKGPVSMHLPPGCPRVALSRVAPDSVSLREFVRRELSGSNGVGGGERRAGSGAGASAAAAAAAAAAAGAANNDAAVTTPIFIVGAHSHGQASVPYADRWISISDYPLSAACVLARITGALEEAWGIS